MTKAFLTGLLRLVDGVGIARLAPPTTHLATVRILDARGSLVAEVPVERG